MKICYSLAILLKSTGGIYIYKEVVHKRNSDDQHQGLKRHESSKAIMPATWPVEVACDRTFIVVSQRAVFACNTLRFTETVKKLETTADQPREWRAAGICCGCSPIMISSSI